MQVVNLEGVQEETQNTALGVSEETVHCETVRW